MSMPITKQIRRDQVKPGMIIHSSHGYRLLITKVDDSAPNRSDDRHVGFHGHLHADPQCALRTERYPAGSLIEVEVPDEPITLVLTREKFALLIDTEPTAYNLLPDSVRRAVRDESPSGNRLEEYNDLMAQFAAIAVEVFA